MYERLALVGFLVACLTPAGATVAFLFKFYTRFVRLEAAVLSITAILKARFANGAGIPPLEGGGT